MNKCVRTFVVAVVFIGVLVLIIGCSSRFISQTDETDIPDSVAKSNPVDGLIKTNDSGRVTIEVEWGVENADSLSFKVVMDTHSVNLDRYDLSEMAVLSDDTGNEYFPLSWNSAPGGHHRRGVLTFPLPESLKEGSAKYLELVIRDVAGIQERVLKWGL